MSAETEKTMAAEEERPDTPAFTQQLHQLFLFPVEIFSFDGLKGKKKKNEGF